MPNGTKVYNIKINGLQESVSAADALINKLDTLEKRLNALGSKGISIGGGTSASKELDAQASLLDKIAREELKVEEARDKNYQYLVKIKDELKQVTTAQKAAAAASKLDENNYNLNTMAGIKERLKDIKALMQTTDIGSDLFQSLIDEADELNIKLKDIETQYGQFGRNVGNYSSALSGLTSLTLTIGDTEVQFKNATEAARELKRQMDSLSASGKRNSEEFKNLNDAYNDLKRNIGGTSEEMGALLNTFQSIGAIASISGGFSAFFGNKNTDLQKSIQRLVALQNVLQGIESLRKQMDRGEGIGGLLSKGNQSVDRFVALITRAKVGVDGLTMSSRGATTAVRALSTALKGIGVGAIIAGVLLLSRSFEKVTESIADGLKQTDAFKSELDNLTKSFERRNEALKASYLSGRINGEQLLNQSLKLQNEYLKDNIKLLQERSGYRGWASAIGEAIGGRGIDLNASEVRITGMTSSQTIKGIEEAKNKWKELNQEMKRGVGFFDDLFGVTSRNLVTTGNFALSDYINRLKNLDLEAEDASEQIQRLYDEMNNDEVLSSVLANLDKYIPDEAVRDAINSIIGDLQRLRNNVDANSAALQSNMNSWRLDLNTDDLQRQLEQLKQAYDEQIAEYALNEEAKTLLTQRYEKQRRDILKQMGARRLNDENEIQRRLIAAMKDGLAKQLAELELERKQASEQAVQSERMVNEKLEAINKEYDKKVLDAKREYKEQMIQVYNEMWTQIYENQMEIETMMSNADIAATENMMSRLTRDIFKSNADSPYIRGYALDFVNMAEDAKDIFRGHFSKEILKAGEQYRYLNDQIELQKQNLADVLDMQKDEIQLTSIESMELEKLTSSDFFKANEEAIKNAAEYSRLMFTDVNEEALEKQFDSVMSTMSKYNEQRLNLALHYYDERMAVEKEQANKEYEFARQEELRSYEMLMDSYKKQRKLELDGLVQDEDYQKNRQSIIDKYNELIDTSTDQHQKKLEALSMNHARNMESIEESYLYDMQTETMNAHQNTIREYEKFSNKLSQIVANYPVYDRSGWGIVDMAASKRRNQEVLDGVKALAGRIIQEKEKLQQQLSNGEITFVDWKQANDQLDALQDDIAKTADAVVKNGKNIIGDFINSINTYVQALGSGLQNILSWVSDYEDSVYEHRREQLEKHIQEYEDALNKQEDITKKYADNVNSIEDELSTARGDRRQQLIDMLNQQKAAQRASLNEEKKIEKEKEAMEAKKEQLELEQRRREHKRQITDAIVSAALAVVNGLATKPFVPVGIAMGALAGALGAVQVALIKAQKYKDGGVIDGASHSRGGVKVLGGRAEVEGGEFITNKQTTAKNIQLLDFINSKKKKVDLDDLVEFYGGGLKKQVKTVKTKFADGGTLPTLRSDISINDRFVRALEAYESKPTVVSVVEIMDKTKNVRDVQAIAGLTDE